MKKFNEKLVVMLVGAFIFGLINIPIGVFAATSPALGTLTDYSVLGHSTVTCTGATVTDGAVGVSDGTSITGFPTPCTAGGGTHSDDSSAIAAQADNLEVFGDLDQDCDHTYGSGQDLTALSPLDPGVYCSGGSFFLSGNLNLTGSGVWIFKSASTLITAPDSSVTGGDSCDIWWRVGSSATIDTDTVLKGNILADASVTLNGGATLDGRATARSGAVTLDGNTITEPTCAAPPSISATLHIVKEVINDDSGTADAADFTINIAGTTNISPNNFPGSEDGVDVTLDKGSYSVTETGPLTGYSMSASDDCSGTIDAGDTKICTITNDDDAVADDDATINVVKMVINDDRGNKDVADFPLSVNGTVVESGATNTFSPGAYIISEITDSGYVQSFSADCGIDGHVILAAGDHKFCIITNDDVESAVSSGSSHSSSAPLIDVVKVPSPLALPAGPGRVTYTYTLRNIGKYSLDNIKMVEDTCSPVSFVSGDNDADGELDVNETWIYRCSVMLAETHTNTIVASGTAKGMTATDIASATVIVGASAVPPLIHLTKVASPAAVTSGGSVTYIETVTNPGTVALSDVRLTDDKCAPVKYISGDENGNSKLDTDEAWTYYCQANIVKTTTNTAVVEGTANGLTAKDLAIATVIVGVVPKLPNTGINSEGKSSQWSIIISAVVLMSALALTVASIRKCRI